MHANGIITLTTDFGTSDGYVGTMKGVILGIAPHARLIDITHSIHPQDIHQATYVVETFHRYFSTGTIHLIVINPGVGTERRAIALATPEAVFIAPDNGVLTTVWRDAQERWGTDGCQVYELAEKGFWLPHVSDTFHGRDVFAPVAAHLAAGMSLDLLGPHLTKITEATLKQPTIGRRGELVGQIIHLDHFGNCITNITPRHLHENGMDEHPMIHVIDQRIEGICRTYSDGEVGALIVLLGSSGRLELAMRNGNAAQMLGVGIGDIVRVFPGKR